MNMKMILPAVAALFLAASPAFAEGGMMEHKGHGEMAEHMGCPDQLNGVKTEKKAVKNGIEILMTAETPEAAAELRKNAAAHYAAKECPMIKGADEINIENVENGIKVTLTAKKPAAVKKLQASLKKGHTCGCCGGGEGEKAAVKTSAAYVCPMGDFEGSDKPGKCPKCGMQMAEKK